MNLGVCDETNKYRDHLGVPKKVSQLGNVLSYHKKARLVSPYKSIEHTLTANYEY